MKRFLTIALVGVALCFSASAQKSIPHAVRTFNEVTSRRTEIILPQVKGFNCYKGDFHIHTSYSDGRVNPAGRVVEAWLDGLDVIAITDHFEGRKGEQRFMKVIAPYFEGKEPLKYQSASKAKRVKADFDAIHQEAVEQLEKSGYPMLLVKGCEMARGAQTHGHFNALFLQNFNNLYDADLEVALSRVKEQGGIVIHNHPAYRRETTDKSEWQEEVYKEKLIDGVEIVNGTNFYPKMIRRCVEENLIMISATDAHRPTSGQFKDYGFFRTMTIILAKNQSEKAIKDALLKRRTIAYSGGELMGEEKWLTELVKASVSCQDLGVSKKKGLEYQKFVLINKSSLTYKLRWGKAAYCELGPFKSAVVELRAKDGNARAPKFTVDNMWMMDYKHPSVTLEVIQ